MESILDARILPKQSFIHLCLVVAIVSMIFMSGCASGAGGGGGGGAGNVSGITYDINYNPISNANVVMGSDSTKTLSNGIYQFINAASGDKVIKISSAAYTPAYRTVTVAGGTSVNAGAAFLANLDGKVTNIDILKQCIATNTDARIKMIFPVNSFASDTDVVLTAVPKIAAPFNPPEEKQFVSYIVYAKTKPTDVALSATAELYVPNLTGITTQFVDFYRFNENTLQWQWFATGSNEVSTKETNPISVKTKYMGWIAAIMLITPAPGTLSGIIKDSSSMLPISGANVWTESSYAVTNSSGQYTLYYVPTGTTTVHASALNYNSGSQTVIVVSGTNPPLADILLNRADQGTITGYVKDNTLNAIENARVSESHGGGVTFTDSYGRYTLYNVPVGTTILAANAAGHLGSTEVVTVESGKILQAPQFYLLETEPASTYSFSFEAGTEGFTTINGLLWHRQDYNTAPRNYYNRPQLDQTQKVTLPDTGYMPTAHSGNYYFWYGQETLGTGEGSYIVSQDADNIATTESYDDGGRTIQYWEFRNIGTLESPTLDLTGYVYSTLSFWTWWEIEGRDPSLGFDLMEVLISKDYPAYSTWTSLGVLNPKMDPTKPEPISAECYSSGGYNQSGVWVKHSIDLSSYVGNKIRIRFRFEAGDRKFNGYRGWVIDDVAVSNTQYGVSSFGRGLNPPIKIKPRPR